MCVACHIPLIARRKKLSGFWRGNTQCVHTVWCQCAPPPPSLPSSPLPPPPPPPLPHLSTDIARFSSKCNCRALRKDINQQWLTTKHVHFQGIIITIPTHTCDLSHAIAKLGMMDPWSEDHVTHMQGLNYKKYSTASDVYSYGMVLYEIWSLGEKPLKDIPQERVSESRHTMLEKIQTVICDFQNNKI